MKIFTFVLIGLVYIISSPAVAADTHCNEQEQIVFSCSLGKKIVSVCASSDLSLNNGYLQYRIGQGNTLELILPNSTKPGQHIQARTLMFSGGGGSYLRFINGDYHYIVYTAIGKGWGVKDGVSVEKNNKLIANLKCQDIPVSIMGDEFFTRAGLPVDKNEFFPP